MKSSNYLKPNKTKQKKRIKENKTSQIIFYKYKNHKTKFQIKEQLLLIIPVSVKAAI